MSANTTPEQDGPETIDLPPLQRWICTEVIKLDASDLDRLAKAGGFELIVEADELGLAVYDLAREPVLWVDVITPDGDARDDFAEEMDEFRQRIEGRSPALVTRVLDRARCIVALSPFRRAAPEAAEALAAAVGAQVTRQGDAVLHIVGEGFKDASGTVLLAEQGA
ncbi:MAG: hypothetical protein KJS97_11420 [Alphaproteobacteria bacterium]|nr:hypothetical protein [Alphaproteobacteria bacterium]